MKAETKSSTKTDLVKLRPQIEGGLILSAETIKIGPSCSVAFAFWGVKCELTNKDLSSIELDNLKILDVIAQCFVDQLSEQLGKTDSASA